MISSVHEWLEQLGLTQYAEAFESNDIDVELLTR
jgi:SAM domain (Sterile alpha motif)